MPAWLWAFFDVSNIISIERIAKADLLLKSARYHSILIHGSSFVHVRRNFAGGLAGNGQSMALRVQFFYCSGRNIIRTRHEWQQDAFAGGGERLLPGKDGLQ
jgi:hypothetical protein